MLPVPIQRELAHAFGEQYLLEPIKDRGLSHARVFRVESQAGSFALKRLPIAGTLEKLQEQHRFQAFLNGSGFHFVPELQRWSNKETVYVEDQCFWELATWKHGTPIESVGEINDWQLLEAVECVARMHRRSRLNYTRLMIPPGIVDRERKLYQFLNDSQFQIEHFLRNFQPAPETEDAFEGLRHIFRISEWLAPLVLKQLHEISNHPQTCIWIIRDLWRDHLLFVGQRLTGIIDFGAARVDSGWFDLSRMLGTLLMDSDPRWSLAVDRYNNILSSTPVYEGHLKLLHRVSTVISGLHWLEWLASAQSELTDRGHQPLKRIHEISRQLRDIELHWQVG